MDGSDDYVFDDIEFDEQTLAMLDKEEKKYQLQTQQKAPSNLTVAPRVEPPPKRQKTYSGWTPGGSAASSSRATEDDLPEISLHGDGSYAIGHRPRVTHAPVQQKIQQASVPSGPTPNIYAARIPSVQAQAPSTSQTTHSNGARVPTARAQNRHPSNPVQAPAPVSAQSPSQTALQMQVAELQKKLDEVGTRLSP